MPLGRFARIAKAVVAGLFAAGAVAAYLAGNFAPVLDAAIADSTISYGEAVSLVTILSGVWGVWRVPNKPSE